MSRGAIHEGLNSFVSRLTRRYPAASPSTSLVPLAPFLHFGRNDKNYGAGDGDGTIVGVAVGLGVGVGVGVAVGAGAFEPKSSSSSKDVESLGAEDVDDSSDVPPDNVVVVDDVEALVVTVVGLDVAEAAGVGIGWRCFR